MKIVLLSNYTKSLVAFRGALIRRLVELGHNVVVIAPEDDEETVTTLNSMGAGFRRIGYDRTSKNVFYDLWLILNLWRLLSSERAQVLISYTIKPVIYGSIAARLAGVARCYSVVTGLGYVFIGDSISKRMLRHLVVGLYRWSIALNDRVFFLNKDDLATFLDRGIVGDRNACMLINGEGVDVRQYTPESVSPECVPPAFAVTCCARDARPGDGRSTNATVFLLIARLLKDKGIAEYVTAARIVKRRHPDSQFWIVGPLDSNPAAITRAELQQWCDDGVITYLGEQRDVRPYLRQSSVYVLPSYREGLPRTILEAMAMGKPIVTTDAPGCRETVVDNDNGFVVPIKDAPALAQAMEEFIRRPELLVRMGLRSREIAVERFDVNKVNDVLLHAMGLV